MTSLCLWVQLGRAWHRPWAALRLVLGGHGEGLCCQELRAAVWRPRPRLE